MLSIPFILLIIAAYSFGCSTCMQVMCSANISINGPAGTLEQTRLNSLPSYTPVVASFGWVKWSCTIYSHAKCSIFAQDASRLSSSNISFSIMSIFIILFFQLLYPPALRFRPSVTASTWLLMDSFNRSSSAFKSSMVTYAGFASAGCGSYFSNL